MRAVNLIPAGQRPGGGPAGGSSGGGAYVIVGFVMVLAALTALYASARHTVSSKEAEAKQLSAEASEAESAANALAPYTRFVTLREERVKDVQELAGTRFDWAHVMHELGRVLPHDASLSSVQGTIGAATASGTTTTPTTTPTPTTAAATSGSSSVASTTPAGSAPVLTIAGCATTQAAAALTMDRLRLMNGVSTVSLQNASKAGSTGGGGNCEGGVTFSMTVDFEGLPQPRTNPGNTTTSATSTSAGSAGSSGSSVESDGTSGGTP